LRDSLPRDVNAPLPPGTVPIASRANSRRRGGGNAWRIGTSCNDWNESGTNRGRIGDSCGCAQPVGPNA
jgi:hypothetical protein